MQKSRDVIAPTSKYYVYFIYLPDRPTPVYVGKGQKDRYRHYFYYAHKVHNRILRKRLLELRNRGEDYYVHFAFETDCEQEALDVESFYISYFGRVFNGTGILYNFDISTPVSASVREGKRKPVYVDGFVFDSVSRLREKTGMKNETLKKYTQIGRAAYLDSSEQVQRVFEREKRLKYHFFYKRHRRAITKAKKNFLISEGRRGPDNWMYGKTTTIAIKIEVDGVVYASLSKAAREHGFSKGYSFKRHLLNGKHDHTYKFIEE